MKKRRFSQQSSTQGFTLIEVLVVIVMIGILFAISAPGWLAFINNQRVGTALNQTFETLRAAQVQAKQTKLSRAVVFDNNSNQPRIATVPVLDGETCPAIASVKNWQTLGQGEVRQNVLSLTNSPANPTCVIFDTYGAIPDDLSAAIPYVVAIEAVNSPGSRRCIVVDTVLGAMRQASRGEANCN